MGDDERFDRGQATRERLLAAATRLFAEHGYEAVSIEAVLETARVSRGSLYYHFSSKADLFRWVLERQEERIRDTVLEAVTGIEDPVAALHAGCAAWLQLAEDPVIQRVVLVDAPSVVGWATWREIDARNGFGLLKFGLQAAAAAGRMEPELVDPAAHVLLAALIELAMVIARSDDPATATRHGRETIGHILNGVLGA